LLRLFQARKRKRCDTDEEEICRSVRSLFRILLWEWSEKDRVENSASHPFHPIYTHIHTNKHVRASKQLYR